MITEDRDLLQDALGSHDESDRRKVRIDFEAGRATSRSASGLFRFFCNKHFSPPSRPEDSSKSPSAGDEEAGREIGPGLRIRLARGQERLIVAASYSNIGSVHDSQGKYEEALDYYNRALEIDIKISGHDHHRCSHLIPEYCCSVPEGG